MDKKFKVIHTLKSTETIIASFDTVEEAREYRDKLKKEGAYPTGILTVETRKEGSRMGRIW